MTQPSSKRLVTEGALADPTSAARATLSATFARKRPLDPRDYGAVGNGTTDDTTALQACLNAAGSGGVVELPPLTFKVTSTLTIPTGCELRGTGPKGSILATNGDYTALTAVGGEEQSIKNLKIANSFVGTRTTYDVTIVNPFKPVLEHVEIALAQTSLTLGGIHIYKDVGQPGADKCFMPQLNDVWIRNGVLVIEDVTDGKMMNSYIWGTYTGAPGSVQLVRSSNWTFENVDIVPPQGDVAGYLLTDLSNLSILGGLMDGSYDDIMTGHGIKTTGFTRGLSVMGVKFYNLGRSGLKLGDTRRSSFIGNIFVTNNKADGGYADIDITSGRGNTFIGNSHGAPNVRVNKGKIYTEDATATDNVIDLNVMEYNNGVHYYAQPVATVQGASTLGTRNRPDIAWPFTALLNKAVNYTVVQEDLFNDRTLHASNGVTITLPSATGLHQGNKLPIKNVGTTPVTVNTVSGQTIETVGTTAILEPGRAFTVQADATGNWRIMEGFTLAPGVIVPALSMLTLPGATVWPNANQVIFQRFTVPERRTYRYVNFHLDTASGNYQVGVVRLSGTGLTNYTRVMDSGVVATPTAGDKHVDLGATALSPGEYAVFLWFDNVTASTRVAANSGVSGTRLAAETSGLTTGVPATGVLAWASTRILSGITIEADV